VSRCAVCCERDAVGVALCRVCSRSFDRTRAQDDGTLLTVVVWAAARARRFARRGARREPVALPSPQGTP
jgi:IMP cyclohydrolase